MKTGLIDLIITLSLNYADILQSSNKIDILIGLSRQYYELANSYSSVDDKDIRKIYLKFGKIILNNICDILENKNNDDLFNEFKKSYEETK